MFATYLRLPLERPLLPELELELLLLLPPKELLDEELRLGAEYVALLFVELELLDGDEYVSLLRLGVTLRS
jgi:hypothetical protein